MFEKRANVNVTRWFFSRCTVGVIKIRLIGTKHQDILIAMDMSARNLINRSDGETSCGGVSASDRTR